MAAEAGAEGGAGLSDSLNDKGVQIAASPYAMNTPAHKGVRDYGSVSAVLPNVSEAGVDNREEERAPKIETRSKAQLRKGIRETQRKMQQAAKEMDFLAAAKYRDEVREMQAALETARGE